MTDEAIHLFRILEIEVVIDPTVTHMTGGASTPIRLDRDAEVVDNVLLTHSHGLGTAGKLRRLALPAPVSGLQNLVTLGLMASQASPGYILPGFVGPGHETRVIRVGWSFLYMRPGIIRGLFTVGEKREYR
jgi:hypothetical protein